MAALRETENTSASVSHFDQATHCGNAVGCHNSTVFISPDDALVAESVVPETSAAHNESSAEDVEVAQTNVGYGLLMEAFGVVCSFEGAQQALREPTPRNIGALTVGILFIGGGEVLRRAGQRSMRHQ